MPRGREHRPGPLGRHRPSGHGTQQRKAAKQELKAARAYTDTTREYLLSVTPDPCYANMYASAWGVATVLQQWADRASTQPAPLLFNTYSQFVESPQAISCEETMLEE